MKKSIIGFVMGALLLTTVSAESAGTVKKTRYYKQRQQGYEKALKLVAEKKTMHNEFEDAIMLRMYEWWANWKPDYEGWLKCADSLYASDSIIDAIGPEPQVYKDYRLSMKGQRDACEMDMGPIENCVVGGNTVAINYKMYMTPKADMGHLKKGQTVVLEVTEFNHFDNVEGYDVPMVTYLELHASSME